MFERKFSYDAYDIDINNNGECYLLFYKVKLEKLANSKNYAYVYDFIDADYPENMEETIKEIRKKGYLFIREFGFPYEENNNIFCTNIIASYLLFWQSAKIKILEKIYFNETIDFNSYILSGIVYLNCINGKKYFIKTTNHGLYDDKKLIKLELNGYHSITESSMKNNYKNLNSSFARILTKKD